MTALYIAPGSQQPSPEPNRDRPMARAPEADAASPPQPDDLDGNQEDLLDIALGLAALGIPSFPCGANKRPAIPEAEGGHGFKDATTDAAALQALFERAGGRAKLVGVPTGSISGFDVVDIDPRHGGHLWEAQHTAQLGETRIHQSGGGGRHWLFQHADGVGNSAGRIATGVDVRAAGGYVIWPPSPGYSVINEDDIAPWPPWLRELARKSEPPVRPAFVATDLSKITDKRLDGLLRSLLARVSEAPEGLKHDTLLRLARTLGGYQYLLGYTEAQLVGLLLNALPVTVIDWKNAQKTALDGLRHGALAPLPLEERPYRGHGASRDSIAAAGCKSAATPQPPEPEDKDNPEGGDDEPPEGTKPGSPDDKPPPDKPEPRLTGEARQAELERLADLKELDPIEYDNQRAEAANRLGCLLGTLDEVVDKIIAAAAAAPPRPPGPPPDTDEVTRLIAEFNDKYFVLSEAGKTVIYAPKRDHQLHRDYFERITFPDFERLYLNRFVKTGVSEKTSEPIYSQAANVWLRHRNRKQYIGGMVFDPSDRQQPDDVLNLWQGFGVTPQPGSCQKFKDHLLNVIRCNDTMLYKYVLDWMANVVQHPDKRGEIALGTVRARRLRQRHLRLCHEAPARPAWSRHQQRQAPDRALQRRPARHRLSVRRRGVLCRRPGTYQHPQGDHHRERSND